MQREEPKAEKLLLVDEVPHERAREALAGRAAAPPRAGVDRGRSAFRRLRRPPAVSAEPVRAVRVGRTQSNMSIPRAITSRIPSASPSPMKYRGRSAGARAPPSRRCRASARGSRRPRARRGRSRRTGGDLLDRPRPSSVSAPPCAMPNRSWPGARGASTCRSAQSVVRRTASSCSRSRSRPGADVEAHRDVRAEPPLDLGDALGREALRLTVVDRAERHPVVVDREKRVAQREHLEAARVGEDRAAPARERVEPAELLDHVLPGRRWRWYVFPSTPGRRARAPRPGGGS